MATRVSQSLARPIRTAVQAAPAFVITEGIDAFITDLSEKQYGALVALLTLVIGYVQVLVENYSGKALLRSLPSRDVPVVDNDETPEGGIA